MSWQNSPKSARTSPSPKAGMSGALVKDDLERVAARNEELLTLPERALKEPRPPVQPGHGQALPRRAESPAYAFKS